MVTTNQNSIIDTNTESIPKTKYGHQITREKTKKRRKEKKKKKRTTMTTPKQLTIWQ